MSPTRSFPTRPARARRSVFSARSAGRLPAAIALALACLPGLALAQSQEAGQDDPASPDPDATQLDAVMVVAQRASRVSNGATNLDLAVRDTPQSISVVTGEQMRQFGASSVNDALRLATGVRVDEWETNRTSYSARGFDILNTQIDGVGMPNSWGVATGAIDAFGYDKVEVIRGANGLLTGVGNAAGTINYVRKRPTNEPQGMAGIQLGSWSTVRAEVDYSTPFTADGTWAGRVVAAHQDGESWLEANENSRSLVYGVVDGQIGENGTLAFGYSYQRAKSDGIMWGALPFTNADGSQAQWPTSASTTQDWTWWNTTDQTAFVEYTHLLGADWQLKLAYNYRRSEGDEEMFYAYLQDPDLDGIATGLDPDTGLGLVGYPWAGADESTSHLGSVALDGRFQLFGREQQLIVGASAARTETENSERAGSFDSPAWGALPPFPYPSDAIPEPEWGDPAVYATLEQRLRRVFAATRISLSERLNLIAGANHARYGREGNSYGLAADQSTSHTSPYGGLTFDFSDRVLGYVSYSDIYQPQDQVDENDRYLDASKGVNYEVGVKAEWLDQRLLTTLAVFMADQQGLATPTGRYNEFGQTIYAPVDVESKGVEFEAVGKLRDNLDLVLGYTALRLDGLSGNDTYPWVPRRTANLMLTGHPAGLDELAWGIGGRWQSSVWNTEASGFDVRQGSYAVLNAFVAWDCLPNATVRLNVNNIGDEKYINTLRYSGYYGAPRNYMLSFDWRFQ